MTAVELLQRARATGIDLYLVDGQVRYRGPGGAVDPLLPELRRHKPELAKLLCEWIALESAIHACCDARGDTAENRAALLADCWRESAMDWCWLAWYFEQEDARWTH